MLSSELHSIRSLRCFPSVGTEYAAIVSRVSNIHTQAPSCKDVRQICTRFQCHEFHTTKEKVFTKACALPNFFYSIITGSLQVCALPVAMVRQRRRKMFLIRGG